MAVIFTAEASPITGYRIGCETCPNGLTDHSFTDFPAALTFMQTERATHGGSTAHLSTCEDPFCAALGPDILEVEEDPAPKIAVLFAQGRPLLRALGIHPDADGHLPLRGALDPEDFRARVTAAQAAAPRDERDPAGNPATFTLDRLADLRELADFTVRTGRKMQWH